MECDVRREATPPEMGALIIDLAAFRRRQTASKSPSQPVRTDYGSGGYHDAAIKADQARPHEV